MNEQELLKSMNGISDEMLLRSEKNILAVKPDARARQRKYAGYSAIAAGILIAVIFILVINSRKISATNLMDGVEPNALLARAAHRRKLIYRQRISQNIYTGRRERNQSRSCYRGSTN